MIKGIKNLIVINFGALLDQAEEVANTLGLTLIDMRFVKPLDEDILRKYLSEAQHLFQLRMGQLLVVPEALFKNFVQIII